MKIRFVILLLIGLVFSFAACENTEKKTEKLKKSEEAEIIAKGKETALAAFTVLSGNLNKALNEGGVANAVEYCNLAASPLIDSLSKVHKAVIRRTALKVRNPQNGTDPDERPVLEGFHEKDKAGEDLKPVVKRLNSQKVGFYAPIKVNAFCLQCHGKPGETLTEAHYTLLKKLYPEDKATGYGDGDLRGMWSIIFDQELE